MRYGSLERETKKTRPFDLPEQAVVLNVLRTNELGTIEVITDGRRLWLETGPQSLDRSSEPEPYEVPGTFSLVLSRANHHEVPGTCLYSLRPLQPLP